MTIERLRLQVSLFFPAFCLSACWDDGPHPHQSYTDQESGGHIYEWIALTNIPGILTRPLSGLKSPLLISRLRRFKVELPAASNTQTLTFADEALLGDGLLAYITALGLLEWLQLEGVCVDALQLVGLWEEEEGREIRRESFELMPAGPQPIETLFLFNDIFFWLHMGVWSLWWALTAFGFSWPVHLCLCYTLFSFIHEAKKNRSHLFSTLSLLIMLLILLDITPRKKKLF